MVNKLCTNCNDEDGIIVCSDCKKIVCNGCWKNCVDCKKVGILKVVCHECKSRSLRDHYRCTTHR